MISFALGLPEVLRAYGGEGAATLKVKRFWFNLPEVKASMAFLKSTMAYCSSFEYAVLRFIVAFTTQADAEYPAPTT
jgi:hypothetical protein